jgi:hypothetical protein
VLKNASGDVYFFSHADSTQPIPFFDVIKDATQKVIIAVVLEQFDSSSFYPKLTLFLQVQYLF